MCILATFSGTGTGPWHWPLALAPGTGVTLHEPLYMYVPKVHNSPLSLSIAPLSKRQSCKLKPTLPLPLKLELRSNAQTQALALLISTSTLPYLTLPYLTLPYLTSLPYLTLPYLTLPYRALACALLLTWTRTLLCSSPFVLSCRGQVLPGILREVGDHAFPSHAFPLFTLLFASPSCTFLLLQLPPTLPPLSCNPHKVNSSRALT